MKLQAVLFAQAFRLIAPLKPVYIPDIIAALRERYGFVHVPVEAKDIAPLDSSTPIVFRHGKFVREGRPIVINSLALYPQAVTADTPASTDDADAVIDDLLSAADGIAQEISPRRLYTSHVEVRLDVPLEWAASPLAKQMGLWLSGAVRQYDPSVPNDVALPEFRLKALEMLPDPGQLPLPSFFRIDRRDGVPYGDNVYFSQAPLRTMDHIGMLEQFERMVAAQGKEVVRDPIG